MGNIIYQKITSTELVEDYLVGVLTEKLADNKKVLWLIPGGSAIKVAAAVSQSLSIENLTNLTITLTDERYGPVGHPDSNWPQLEAAGFKADGASLQSVLIGKDLEETTKKFAKTLASDLKTADYSLALVGMGPDGHICGIKPGSVAVESNKLAASYESEDFVRITTTAKILRKLDEVAVYAIGKEKWPQFDALDKDVDPIKQPAQLLKSLKKVIIFNDYKGENRMKIAIAGLGRMGMQIARKLSEDGHEVIAHNRHADKVDEAVTYGAKAAYKKEDVIKAFAGEQLVLWLMIPAEVIDEELDVWLKLAPKGSLIIDGGNSDFRLDKDRAAKVNTAGSNLLDVGTSGGVWGYQNGFSMMIGGDKKGYETIVPVFKTLAKPEGAYHYFGSNGRGHFVKMVHNAIEYGMMESLAEGYHMLKEGPFDDLDLAAAGNVWQHHSVVTSWLNELSRQSLAENPELEGIEGVVAESGEARWTLEVAKDLKLPMPAIQTSFDVRLASQKGQTNFGTKLLAAMRNKFGGHAINEDVKK